MSQPLRPLLPATNKGGSVGSPGSPVNGQRHQKRASTKAACEACRKRKSKCSAERPRCSICVERNTPCEYKTLPAETHLTAQKRLLTMLQSRCESYEALFDILRTKQEDEVMNILQRIRAGTEIETVLRTIQEGDLLLQLSVRPEFRHTYEFPYRREMPVGIHEEYRMYQVPYHAVEFVDIRLVSLDITKWTTVPASQELFRSLLEIYFVFEYPFHPFFHKDLFIDDMLNGRQRFCTPMLVNAILAAAWHGYHAVQTRAEYWRPDNLGYRFLAEATRLVSREQGLAKITTVQATAILNTTLTSNGLDELSWSFLRMSIEMAQQLSLFSPSPESDPKWQKAAAITSWGIFNWQALHCYHMFRPPMLREPPRLELPDPKHDPTFFGEVHVRYPGSHGQLDICHGHVFRAVSGFRTILNDVALDIHTSEETHLSPGRLHHHWQRIANWYDHLPACLASERVALPSHLKIHMHMHILIIGLFEPFEHEPKIMSPAGLPSPGKAVAQSKASFETLIRLYYLRHGFESYDPSMILFVSLLAWSSLREYRSMLEAESPDLDAKCSTLMLCAKFLWDQSCNCFVSEAIFCLFKSSLPSKEEVILLREVAEIDDETVRLSHMMQEIRSGWPVGMFSTAKTSVEDSRLSRFIVWCGQMLKGPWQIRAASSQTLEHPESPDAGWVQFPE